MSFNIESFKEKLEKKGISIHAEADCVIAGLSWWVEGIEKAPKLGDLLFYVVNGIRYGVKPSKKSKHDIEWYYDQLKTGMKGAKGYSAGLTQFLNAWVKKGELDIVFKGKVKASEIGASSVTAARAQIVDEEMKKKFEDFQKKVQDISFFGKKPFVCYITKENGVVYVFIETEKRITLISDNQEEVDNALKRFNYMNVSNDPNKAALIYDPEAHVILFNDEENGCIYQMISIDTINFDMVYEALKRDCKYIENAVREVKGLKVTADVPEVKGLKVTADVPEVKETLGELNKENFEGINKDHDRLMYMKVSPKDFITLWKTSTQFNPAQLTKIIFGFKLASRILGSKFENSGIKIEYFFKRKDGKGYIRVEYKDELYIIYVAQSDDNGDIKVVTRKMKKMIPVKNFNLLSTSVSSLAFENATLPPNFKKVWEEVTKD